MPRSQIWLRWIPGRVIFLCTALVHNGKEVKKQFLIAYGAPKAALRKENKKGGKTHDKGQNKPSQKKPEILSASVWSYVIKPLCGNTGSKFRRSEGDRGRDFPEN
jgi:hypothetical protein